MDEAGGAAHRDAATIPLILPPGTFHLSAAVDDRVRRISGAPVRQGDLAHPILAFVAALGGAGMKVADILTLCGRSIEAGPVLASCDIAFETRLQVGLTYQIESRVASLAPKASRRFGHADHLLLVSTVSAAGTGYAHVAIRMIIPVEHAA